MNPSEKRFFISTITRFVVALAILGFAAVVYVLLVTTAPRVQTVGNPPIPPRVTVIAAAAVPVQRQWHGYGTVQATHSADVPARVTATVAQIGDQIRVGRTVKKGQLLVALDASDYRRQVEITEGNLADIDAQQQQLAVGQQQLTDQLGWETQDVGLAEDEQTRIQQLHDRGAANRRDLDLAKRAVIAAQIAKRHTARLLEEIEPQQRRLEAQHSAAQASLRRDQQNVDRCLVSSPIDGVLQFVDVESGENVDTGERVARVVNLHRIEVPLKLPASARSELSVGNRVAMRSTHLKGLRWTAAVARIAPEDDALTRTVTAFVELTQQQGHQPQLAPGMFVAGVVTSDQANERWVVPRRSVQDGRILLVDGGVVRSQQVQVEFVLEGKRPRFNLPDDQWAVLRGGEALLRPGDLVIVNGSTSLLPGEKIDPVVATAASQQGGTAP